MRCLAACVCAVALAAGCSSRQPLQPISLPDLSRLDDSVQAQVRERYERLTRTVADRSTPAESLAAAYGEYGMVLQAAEYFDAAEGPYLNAQAISPDEVRWPYYLAHLYKRKGETDKAEAAFKRALALQPDDLATLIWLGQLHLDQGKADEAQAMFQKASAISPGAVDRSGGRRPPRAARRRVPRAGTDRQGEAPYRPVAQP